MCRQRAAIDQDASSEVGFQSHSARPSTEMESTPTVIRCSQFPANNIQESVRRSDKACLETMKIPQMDLLREVLPIESTMSSVFGHFAPRIPSILTIFPSAVRRWKNPEIRPVFPNLHEWQIPIQRRKNQGIGARNRAQIVCLCPLQVVVSPPPLQPRGSRMNRLGSRSRFLICIMATCMCAGSVLPLAAQDHIPWLFDLEKAKQQAAEQDKLVLLHFSASWCAPCKEIERFVFVNPMAIRAISSQVVPVKVDVDAQSNIADEYQVDSVPYDVLITPAGHVVAERTSPRSSDGYLQLIETGNELAANLTPEVIARTGEIKGALEQAMQRQEVAENAPKTFGTTAQADTNQFQPHPPAHPGAKTPEFAGPSPWSAPQAEEIVINAPDNIAMPRHRASQFIPPDGVQPPTTLDQAPGGDFAPAGQAVVSNQFVPAKQDPATVTNQFVQNAASTAQSAAQDTQGFRADLQNMAQTATQRVAEDTQSFGAAADQVNAAAAEDTQSFKADLQNTAEGVAQRVAEDTQGFKAATDELPNAMAMDTQNFQAAMQGMSREVAQDAQGLQAATQSAAQQVDQMAEQTMNQSARQMQQPVADTGQAKPDMGLDGYCAVSLVDGQQWIKGDARWGCIHRGRLYLFASAEHRDRFLATPDMFSPLLGGADPVEFRSSGKLVNGERRLGVFYGDDDAPPVIVLFSNQANRDQFEADPGEYLRTVRQAMQKLDGDLLLR